MLKKEDVQSLQVLLEVPELGEWYREKKRKGYFCLIIRFPESKEKLRHLFRKKDKEEIYDRFINIFLRDALPVILEMLIKRGKFFIKKLSVLYVSDDLKKVCSIDFEEFPVFFMKYVEGFLEEFASYLQSSCFLPKGSLGFMLFPGISESVLKAARDRLIREMKDKSEAKVCLYIDIDMIDDEVVKEKKEKREE